MLKNYVKIALRNLIRHGRHTLLNVLGLGVAMAACMVVFLVIQYETSYDKHLKGFDQINQVVVQYTDSEGDHFEGGTPFPTVQFLRKDFAGYAFAELMQNYNVQVTAVGTGAQDHPDIKFLEESGVFYAEPELVNMFEVSFTQGHPQVLKDPGNAVLSESMARKYFGDISKAMGRRIRFNNQKHDFQVAGIFRDVPENSDFPFRLIASYEGFKAYNADENNWPLDDWGANTSNHQVYVKLPVGVASESFAKQVAGIEKKYRKDPNVEARTYLLHPMRNVHFDERFPNNGDHQTSRQSLNTLALIGLLIMLMAIINYVNLSTALAVTRSKEVGIRKVMGGNRRQLSWQVYIETACVVLASGIVGLTLAAIVLPYIKNFMVVQNSLTLFTPGSVMFILLVFLLTVILSGLYPAFVMGRFNAIDALKNKLNTSRLGSISLRRALVVLQFAFSQVFIMGTIISVSQMNFIRKADLGFRKESILLVPLEPDNHEAFRNELMNRSDVEQVSFSFDAPSSGNSWETNFAFDKMEDRDFSVRLKFADHVYPEVYGLQLVAGRFYGASDTVREYVVNETFLKKTGIKDPQQAIGKMLRVGGGKPKPVVGVVKDFKVASLHEVVPPLVLGPRKQYHGIAGIKLSSQNLGRSREEINKIWDRLFPAFVFDARFFDENIQRFYEREERLSSMYKVYAVLAILISCLGLYGLISFMVVQKTKEVGVRKVLGADLGSIVYLFSKEFTVLVVIAFALAAPGAWYLMHTWLQDFAYRITPGAGVFLASIAFSLLIAWLTVGYKAIQAGMANPVTSLRSE
jgi:ABC-type antimicrobial peptide transport system permease subunit